MQSHDVILLQYCLVLKKKQAFLKATQDLHFKECANTFSSVSLNEDIRMPGEENIVVVLREALDLLRFRKSWLVPYLFKYTCYFQLQILRHFTFFEHSMNGRIHTQLYRLGLGSKKWSVCSGKKQPTPGTRIFARCGTRRAT